MIEAIECILGGILSFPNGEVLPWLTRLSRRPEKSAMKMATAAAAQGVVVT